MIISNLVPALGWTLLHSLWQGGLLFLLAAPLFQLLKNRSPELRYGIAFTALFYPKLAPGHLGTFVSADYHGCGGYFYISCCRSRDDRFFRTGYS